LFDLADLFNTCIAIAGMNPADLSKRVGADHYIDGVDQTSFWLADKSQSNRYSRIYTLNEYLSGIRMDEFKMHTVLELENALFPRGYTGGFSGSLVTETGGAVMINLYENPQEDVSVGIRHIPISVMLGAELNRYKEVLKKYPPQMKIGF
jgi:arylsulfatase